MSASRPSGMGAGAIPQSEYAAWQQNHRVRLTPWEIETLVALDQVALAAMAEQQKAR